MNEVKGENLNSSSHTLSFTTVSSWLIDTGGRGPTRTDLYAVMEIIDCPLVTATIIGCVSPRGDTFGIYSIGQVKHTFLLQTL